MTRAAPDGNIAQGVKNQFLRRGVVVFTVTMLAGLALANAGLGPSYRLALFFPFLVAAYALHLGLYGTCGFMAARGVRATDDGVEPVADKAALCKMKSLGLRVIASSAITATVATGLLAYGSS